MLVLGILAAVTIGLMIAGRESFRAIRQSSSTKKTRCSQKETLRAHRTGGSCRRRRQGQLCAGAARRGPAAAAADLPGDQVYAQVCAACHAAGIAGAPKFGDKAAWAPRLAAGRRHAAQARARRIPGQGRLHAAEGRPHRPERQVGHERRRSHRRRGEVDAHRSVDMAVMHGRTPSMLHLTNPASPGAERRHWRCKSRRLRDGASRSPSRCATRRRTSVPTRRSAGPATVSTPRHEQPVDDARQPTFVRPSRPNSFARVMSKRPRAPHPTCGCVYETASADKIENNPVRVGVGIGSWGGNAGGSVERRQLERAQLQGRHAGRARDRQRAQRRSLARHACPPA